MLNRNSEADDGPLIVSSDTPATTQQNGSNGKGKAAQGTIGDRDPTQKNFSPTREKVHWTTDVGPMAAPPGGHYLKIPNVPAKSWINASNALNEHVSHAVSTSNVLVAS